MQATSTTVTTTLPPLPLEFDGVVSTHEQLRAVLGQPSDGARRKDIGRLDAFCRAYIGRSPFALIATSDVEGRCDVSPRGDAPGFAAVLDEGTLALPERPGNRRGDTLSNLIDIPRAGLLFLVPGIEETLRVNGRARIVQDAALLERMAVQGRAPKLAIVVDVEEAYFHCAKAFRRSRLWDSSSFAAPGELASLGHIMREQLSIDSCTAEEMEQQLEAAYRTTLY